jgi:hypothetical protein
MVYKYELGDYLPNHRSLKDYTLDSEPEFDLRSMLSLHKSDSLKDLSRTYKMKKYSSSKKSIMIDYLCDNINDLDFIESFLLFTNDEQYAFFFFFLRSDKVEMSFNKASKQPYYLYRYLYFMEIYKIQKRIIFVVPQEVKNIYFELCKTSFPSKRTLYSKIHIFAKAFTNIYGVVNFDYFVDYCNEQLKTNMDDVELANILLEFSWKMNAKYNVFFDYLLHSRIDEYTVETEISKDTVDASNDEAERINSLHENIPIKQMPTDELIKYANNGYFETTPAHERLIDFLKEHNHPFINEISEIQQTILKIVNEIYTRNDDYTDEMPAIEINSFESDEKAMKKYKELLADVEKHTRKWSKNGWTCAELEALKII